MTVGASLRGMFNKNDFVLVPEREVLDRYMDALEEEGLRLVAKREKFPSLNETDVFKYELVVLGKAMHSIALCVQDNISEHPTASDFTIHTTPFKNLPIFKSHVRPHFVIFHSGKAVGDLDYQTIKEWDSQDPRLIDMWKLYTAWIQKPPSTEDEGGEDKGDEDKEPLGRELRSRFEKSPTLNSKSGGQGEQERVG
ncbi:uncharacterized protein EI90DRAFT_3154591 [Cantharellus anzutake]|uniref:uncharacterized protein n=1 Tax=Cantharellus anzutake TaxID=1750568 RepID=UPI001902D416|nr:uncharacterized protein EI90DRAFT_3154591 [Cantharellus anzutake]KAF8331337.1 hypothetical protein EI90DRAFT_3154591 [Cantharellus anzutake]